MEEVLARCRLSLALRHRSDLQNRLVEHYGSARAVFEVSAAELCQTAGFRTATANRFLSSDLLDAAKAEMEWAARKHVRLLLRGDADYPPLLAECPDAPLLLYVCGQGGLSGPMLSVVGTRSASRYGMEQCRQLIMGLANRGHRFTVVSGLAYGIDGCAHEAALEAGLETIAVLPNGLDHIYPQAHRALALSILKQGLLLSEFPSKTDSLKTNFLQRNRIIAGLSAATVVVESKANGGSLITAHHAFDYGRDVLAVPGRITDLRSAGCNKLIQSNKAALISGIEDLEQLLGWEAPAAEKELPLPIDPTDAAIMELIGKEGGSVDSLYEKLSLSLQDISARLTSLEIMGLVKCMPDGRFIRCK